MDGILERISGFVRNSETGLSIALTGYDPWGLFDMASSIPELVEGFPPKSSDILTIDTKGEDIGIDLVREVKDFLSFSPEYSKRKYVILKDAELMTIQAANAFLKTLEEPPTYGVIILTTTMWNYFLPTIRSRVVRFNIPPARKGKSWLGICAEFDSRVVEKNVEIPSLEEAVNYVVSFDEDPTRGWMASKYIIDLMMNSSCEELVDVIDAISSEISGKAFFKFLKAISRASLMTMMERKLHDLNAVRFFDSISRAKVANFNNALTLYNVAIRLRELIEWS